MNKGVRFIISSTSSTEWDLTLSICGGRAGVVFGGPLELDGLGGRGKGTD